MSESRIVELEIKMSYQEDLVAELNQIVSSQQLQIDRLTATCELLHERIKSISNQGGSLEIVDEVPPHY
jgi:SlyX protein